MPHLAVPTRMQRIHQAYIFLGSTPPTSTSTTTAAPASCIRLTAAFILRQQLSGISSKLLHVFENLAATCTAEITRATSRLLLLLSRSRRLRQHAGPACSSSSTTSDAAAAASSALIITTAAAVVAAAATVAAAAAAATRVAVTAGVGFTGICSSSGGSRCRAFNCCDSS